ncbi:MAG: hypothetical protein V1658_02685, partial [Candidatus Micrarchaeota archaeon]
MKATAAILPIALILLSGCLQIGPANNATPMITLQATLTPTPQEELPCEQRATDLRDACLLERAKSDKSADVCAMIQNTASKNECFAFIANYTKIYEICDGIAYPSAKYSCYSMVAQGKGD